MKAGEKTLSKTLRACYYPEDDFRGYLSRCYHLDRQISCLQSPVQPKHSKSIQKAQIHVHINTYTHPPKKSAIWNTYIIQYICNNETLLINVEAIVHKPLIIWESSYAQQHFHIPTGPKHPFHTYPSSKDMYASGFDSNLCIKKKYKRKA